MKSQHIGPIVLHNMGQGPGGICVLGEARANEGRWVIYVRQGGEGEQQVGSHACQARQGHADKVGESSQASCCHHHHHGAIASAKVQSLCCCCCHVAVACARVCRPRAGFCGNRDRGEVYAHE